MAQRPGPAAPKQNEKEEREEKKMKKKESRKRKKMRKKKKKKKKRMWSALLSEVGQKARKNVPKSRHEGGCI